MCIRTTWLQLTSCWVHTVGDMQAAFTAAAESVKTFEPSTPVTDDEKLKVYGLYKQATTGDVNTAR